MLRRLSVVASFGGGVYFTQFQKLLSSRHIARILHGCEPWPKSQWAVRYAHRYLTLLNSAKKPFSKMSNKAKAE